MPPLAELADLVGSVVVNAVPDPGAGVAKVRLAELVAVGVLLMKFPSLAHGVPTTDWPPMEENQLGETVR